MTLTSEVSQPPSNRAGRFVAPDPLLTFVATARGTAMRVSGRSRSASELTVSVRFRSFRHPGKVPAKPETLWVAACAPSAWPVWTAVESLSSRVACLRSRSPGSQGGPPGDQVGIKGASESCGAAADSVPHDGSAASEGRQLGMPRARESLVSGSEPSKRLSYPTQGINRRQPGEGKNWNVADEHLSSK